MNDCGPSIQFVRLQYQCKQCGARGVAKLDKSCTPEWGEKLFAMLTCNPCHEDLTACKEAAAKIGRINATLANGYTVKSNQVVRLSHEERHDMETSLASWRLKLADSRARLQARKARTPELIAEERE